MVADPVLTQNSNASRSHLPAPPNALIGRAYEMHAVCDLLRRNDVRLVTLTGTGGAGKTRLALEIARACDAAFPDGAWFVPLAAVLDPQRVPDAIATALDIREISGTPLIETLKHTLAGRRQLVVLDNLEQVLAVVPLIGELLDAAPFTKFLVTSRAALRTYGEYEFPVPALGSHAVGKRDAADHPAVQLFAERARAVQGQFQLSAANAPVVLELCERLDSLPLAIELAAARSKIFSPQAILARMDSRLTLLTGGARNVPVRQQTLRGALDWSYELLNPAERSLLMQMGVFRGGATWDAIAAVAGISKTRALEIVTGLIDQSLLRLDDRGHGETRVMMLETICEYAHSRLDEAGEADATGARHFAYFANLADKTEDLLWGHDAVTWLDRLEREHDNLRAALEWGADHMDADALLDMNCNLARFWLLHNHFTEGAASLSSALVRGAEADPITRGRAFRHAGALFWRKGDTARAGEMFEASYAQFLTLHDALGINRAQIGLATIAWGNAERDRAHTLFQNSLDESRALNDVRSAGFCLNALGELARWERDYARARTLHQANLAHHDALGDLRGIAIANLNLGLTAVAQQDYARGAEWLMASADGFRELGERQNTPYVLMGLAEIAAARGEYERAGLLLGAMDALCDALDFHLWGADAAEQDARIAKVREHLEPGVFEEIWKRGRGMTIEEAVGE